MSSKAEDKLQGDIEVVVDGFKHELTAILKFSSYETPIPKVLEDLIGEFEFTLKTLKTMKKNYQI